MFQVHVSTLFNSNLTEINLNKIIPKTNNVLVKTGPDRHHVQKI